MNFSWKPKVKVEDRIEQLNFHNNIQLQFKPATSPTIELLKKNEKVKKTKEIYENGLHVKGLNAYADHWMVNSKKQSKTTEPTKKHDHIKEQMFLNDLIACEIQYLEKLQKTSSIFTMIIQQTSGYISKMVRDHHIGLSGFLEDIIDLHKLKILPKFKANKSFSGVLRYMLQLIENNELYLYVSHSILYNSTLQWLDNYKIVLDSLYSNNGTYYNKLEIHDIIGLYKDWIDDVCDELSKDPLRNADDMALCMDIETKLDQLMDAIDDGKKVACIKEISKNNIEAIDKLYRILTRKKIICHPMLILVPRHDCNYGYRNPIDVLKLGKFVRVWSEMLYSESSKCHYCTNLFIFELCIIYTIVVNDKTFIYNGHFWIKDCEFQTVMKNDKPVILAVLCCGDRHLILDNQPFVSAVMRLHALHKYDEIDGDIELPVEKHLKILSKIEIRRMSLASSEN
ncbi:unnamed protein product [Chironomus riparius]|uniref:DH domain-containing protein n=1 Tax=Chironomus riparius TaxID=315576 RepID=A0A9N9WQ88_9DIPT|nr:unnamed protein product [Chironomus riparius]